MEPIQAVAWTLEFGYGLVALLAGILVLALAPGKRSNQALAWLLIVDGIGMGGMAANAINWGIWSDEVKAGLNGALSASFALVPFLYLNFVGTALKGPIASALASTKGRLSLAVLAVAWFAFYVFVFKVEGIYDDLAANVTIFTLPLVASGLLGLWASVQFLRRAEPEDATKAKAYFWAFVSRDVGYVFFYGSSAIFVYLGRADWLVGTGGYLWLAGIQTCWVIFILLLIYGMLRGQIAGLDGKYRAGMANGAAGLAIAFLFVVGTESMERLFNVASDWLSMGVAVGLAFTFRPLQSLAEHGAHRLLPAGDVDVATYEAAVAKALEDGTITRREQRVLDELKARMR